MPGVKKGRPLEDKLAHYFSFAVQWRWLKCPLVESFALGRRKEANLDRDLINLAASLFKPRPFVHQRQL